MDKIQQVQIVRTSKKDFELFKKSFLSWACKLYCPHQIYFYHEPLEGVFANVCVDEAGKCATVRYNLVLDKENYSVRSNPQDTGKHEAIHLFLHRLIWLGDQRFVGKDESQEEWERLVRILEKVLK